MFLKVGFPTLTTLVKNMGAMPISWSSKSERLETQDIKEILLQGKLISLEEVEITDDGLFAFQGEHVLLYIKDSMKDKETLLYDVANGPKFHLADCRTLDTMRANNRYDRYVVTNNTSGDFNVEYSSFGSDDRGEVVAKLKVCKNCLNLLSYKNYKRVGKYEKTEICDDFSIEEFFETYKSHFKQKPTYTDETAPTGGYAANWAEISKSYRQSVNWVCEKCNVDLSGQGHKSLLHVHHKNGVKGENNRSNLEALCQLCHSDQPQHAHMHIKPSDKAKLLELRRQTTNASNHKNPKKVTKAKLAEILQKHPLHTSKPKVKAKPKSQIKVQSKSLTKQEVRNSLIQLRAKIWNEQPNVDHSKGVLRKTMLKHFLEDKVSSEADYNNKIPKSELKKTDQRQTKYLNEIFSVIKLMK